VNDKTMTTFRYRDESDRDGMRIVIELKRGAEPQIVLISSSSTRRCRKASA